MNFLTTHSGESGAGKTESAKFLISHIVELSKGTSLTQQQILQVKIHFQQSAVQDSLCHIRTKHRCLVWMRHWPVWDSATQNSPALHGMLQHGEPV